MKWTRERYFVDSVTMARNLIGAHLVHNTKEGRTVVRITEAEAYGGFYEGKPDDGAHAYKGLTDRTRVIFGEGGFLYVYTIYGMYNCFDVVCDRKGVSGTALLRAGEPLEGIELMEKRRGKARGKLLTCGPARLAMAMGIDKSLYGLDLTGDELYIEDGEPMEIEVSKRKNIDYATYGKDFPWRFTAKGSKWVSK